MSRRDHVSIWGRVVDAAGSALPGAEVFWVAPEHEGKGTVTLLEVHKVAQADSGGRFFAADLPRGRGLLVPDIERLGFEEERVRVVHGTAVTLPLPADGDELVLRYPFTPASFSRLAGRLLDADGETPVADHPVLLVDATSGSVLAQRPSGSEGAFGFGILRPGKYVLAVPASLTHSDGGAPIELMAGKVGEAVVRVSRWPPEARRHSVTVRVEDESGIPVAGARIRIEAKNAHLPMPETDASGRAVVADLPLVPDALVAFAEGFWPAGSRVRPGPEGLVADPIVIRRTADLRVVVRDAGSGATLVHANVTVEAASGTQWDLGGVHPAREEKVFALLPGPAVVRAEAPGRGPGEVHVDVPPGGLPDPVVVELAPREG